MIVEMSRVVKIEITEEAETLKKIMRQQKDKSGFERVQVLYLLKIKQVETVGHLAVIIGRGRRTIQRWRASIPYWWTSPDVRNR